MSAATDFVYAPALEAATSLDLRAQYGLFIGGAWSAAENDRTFATENPATEDELARVAHASDADVDRAVRAARRGYEKYWRKLRPSERAKYAFRIARLIAERATPLALAQTLDAGTPIRDARDGDVALAATTAFYCAGWADKLAWLVAAGERPRPHGVVGAIVAADAPLLGAVETLAAALACGNAVVLKPSATTPLCALLLAELVAEADLPPGAFNVVTGDDASDAALAEHADVDLVSFSGARDAGKAIRRARTGPGRPVLLDLGGTTSIVVFEDAALDQAVDGIALASFANAGQDAWSASRLLVQESVADVVLERVRERLATIRHGDPLDRNTDLGPLLSRRRRDRVLELIAQGVEDGATLHRAPWTPPERGYFVPAAVFANVAPTHRIARERIAGPVVAAMTFRTPDEAIERANNVPDGLAASVWTSSGALAMYVAAKLRAGVVWSNTCRRLDASADGGGLGEAGLGRRGGAAGMRAYLVH